MPTILPALERREIDTIRQALSQQSKYLARCVDEENDGVRRLTAAFGLAYAGLAFSGDGQWVRRGRGNLARIAAANSRRWRPCQPLARHSRRYFKPYLALEAAMQARTVQVPATLVETRKRMQAMLALICHSDGGLGLFNGAPRARQQKLRHCSPG